MNERMTSYEAAEFLGKSDVTLRVYRWAGKGPEFNTDKNGKIFYYAEDLVEWMNNKSSERKNP